MNLDNINSSSPKRSAHSDGINKPHRSESPNRTDISSGEKQLFKSDEIHLSSHKYSNDLEFSLGVYDKLDATALKNLKKIKVKYNDGLHNTDEVQENISKSLAKEFNLEQLNEQVFNSIEKSTRLTSEQQEYLTQSDEVLRSTAEQLINVLKNL